MFGLFLTLMLQAIYQKAVPGLPIPIFLGLILIYLTSEVYTPFLDQYQMKQIFIQEKIKMQPRLYSLSLLGYLLAFHVSQSLIRIEVLQSHARYVLCFLQSLFTFHFFKEALLEKVYRIKSQDFCTSAHITQTPEKKTQKHGSWKLESDAQEGIFSCSLLYAGAACYSCRVEFRDVMHAEVGDLSLETAAFLIKFPLNFLQLTMLA